MTYLIKKYAFEFSSFSELENLTKNIAFRFLRCFARIIKEHYFRFSFINRWRNCKHSFEVFTDYKFLAIRLVNYLLYFLIYSSIIIRIRQKLQSFLIKININGYLSIRVLFFLWGLHSLILKLNFTPFLLKKKILNLYFSNELTITHFFRGLRYFFEPI